MNDQQSLFTPATIIQLLIVVVLIPFLPLLITWRWTWWEAWAYAVVFIGGFVASRALAARRHPDLLAERASALSQENIAPWDRTLALLVTAVLVIRTTLEDRFLHEQLPGYPAYAARTRYRLLPGIW